MKPFVQKKTLAKKKALALSPVGLALAACGGGGGGETSSSTMAVAIEFPLTGNNFIDASTQGSKWSTSNGPLTYAVANGFSGETWNDISGVNAALSLAMAQLEHFTNLQVENLGNFSDPTSAANGGATIVLSLDGDVISSNMGDTVWAVGHYPDTEDTLYDHIAGDMFLNINSAANYLPAGAYVPGGKGFMLLLHELGHTIGLKHPHDDGGNGRLTYEEAGYAQYDDQTYTLMAYDDEFGDVLNAPSTFMLGDVLGLMSLYGVNQNTNTGDTTYSFYNSTVRKTLWDASGSDTLDLTAMTDPVTIYLTDFYSEADLGIEYGHIIQNPGTVSQKWHHLLGEYESVSCGSGNDVIFGDENANILSGGAGDDFIGGYEGNDILYGGAGEDFFMLAAGHGQDIIRDFKLGVDTCGFWNGSNYDASLATLSSDVNGDAIYHLADGSSLLLEGVLHADIASIA